MKKHAKLTALVAGIIVPFAVTTSSIVHERIPVTWDIEAIHKFHLPPPDTTAQVEFASKAYYDSLPEHAIYKTYPVYVREHEPTGYLDSLRTLNPEVAFDLSKIKTKADWIIAGELVFNWPVSYSPGPGNEARYSVKDFDDTKTRLLPGGEYGFLRYIITERGKIQTGSLSCASCHTRVLKSGIVVPGGQGNVASSNGLVKAILDENIPWPVFKDGTRRLSYTPWASDQKSEPSDKQEAAAYFDAMPMGTIDRQGASFLYPLAVPSLIGIKDIKYLDHTGLMKHDSPGDMMRYAAFNQGMDMLTKYNGFIPGIMEKDLTLASKWVHPFGYARKRYSDAQLYALTKYLYSLRPPDNPNKFPKKKLERGQMIFAREGCVTCHTPPLYTNNKLTPVSGFRPPKSHYTRYDIFDVPVLTDSVTTLYSRRGTGYYKVPSLRGVWFRDAFFHNGNLNSLEEVFNPERLMPEYSPSGYKPPGVETMPVKGHPFGLTISDQDKEALIAFLKTL